MDRTLQRRARGEHGHIGQSDVSQGAVDPSDWRHDKDYKGMPCCETAG